MGKKGKFSGYIDFYGSKELIQKLDKVSKNLKEDLSKVFLKSANIPAEDIKNFMIEHQGVHQGKHTFDYYFKPVAGSFKKQQYVGRTEKGKKGFASGSVKTNDDDTIYVQAGFLLPKKGSGEKMGLAALFWDIGAGGREPKATYFVFYAINKHFNEIKDLQTKEIMKLINGVL